MSEIKKLNENELEEVVGGKIMTIENTTPGFNYANVMSSPNGKVVGCVYNGQQVNTTGNKAKADGKTWLEVKFANGQIGWIASSMMVDIAL